MGTTTSYKCCCFHCWDGASPPPKAPPPPKDVGALFSLYAGGGPGGAPHHMDEDGLRRYLSVYQGEGTNVEHLLEQIRRQQLFTLDDFHRIVVFSDELNPPIRHQHRVHHDMTLPLSHYFIYSGHNPYYHAWRPDQRRRRSSSGRSDGSIIRELKMGVRAIEVAMWPYSKGDDIQIHHGWNTPVLLTQCLKSIKKYAFLASPYPVIIRLEDNLQSTNLQKKAAKVVLDVLGDILYWPYTDHIDIEIMHILQWPFIDYFDLHVNTDSNKPLKNFPSPEELKGRVLLSTKTPTPILKKEKSKPNEVDESMVDDTIEKGDAQLQRGKGADDDDAAWGPEVPDFQTEIQSAKKHDSDVSTRQRQRQRIDDNADDDQKEQKMQPQEYPLYRHLITIRAEKQKGSLADALQKQPDAVWPSLSAKKEAIEKAALNDALQSDPDKVRRLSWSEKQIQKAAEDLGTTIVRFTQRNILWINPSFSTKGYRRPTHLSSNYNPFLGWLHGAQMVALNMEEYGRALWLMHGFYRANGGCGYVRKPDFLMVTEPEVFDPRASYDVFTTLKVKVYMGDGWRMDFKHTQAPDFWTSIGITGVPKDTTTMKNSKATENTWIPVWGHEFSFPLTVPEIALLRVEVHQYNVSEKDVFGGQTVLPVWELRPGIRAVALFDRQGNRFTNNVKLLMRFEFV
ncbi:phosphoinositide phospholipase C 2 [Sorghum bicolor]|uniref:Phosphoinositide phospholipase C n=2 Tax=Sorghum bicolor TaxID=4558 RepID=C5Y3M4_SORBI|nr:phosphoinositide phospholipase C 2 [Sorghum bicolor]EES09168.2 hypothetical protein SORBI_3005G018900 [Sorghum bicolor]|eukprot:XP_021317361.1 phosphoinositide phospholipase C 2 [Sorghum bicolor]